MIRRREFLVACAALSASRLAHAADPRGLSRFSRSEKGTVPLELAEVVVRPPLIDAAFPGGNILLERIDGDHVYLKQDLRDTEGHWFYWYFRVRNARGRTLQFHFTRGDVLTSRGPCASVDGGRTWRWLGRAGSKPEFAFTFPADAADVRFCLAVPYLEAELKQFLARHAGSEHLKVDVLAKTKKGRACQRLHLGKLDAEPRFRVLLTARHHACEMIADWTMEGVMESVLADDTLGQWLRENVEILAIPFVDKDGVEEGDQGKNRRPHDHNRDYGPETIYPTVAALKQFVPEWSRGRLRLAFDLHCPSIRGKQPGPGSNEDIFLVGHPAAEQWAEATAFSNALAKIPALGLPFTGKHNIPWGSGWNKLDEPRTCARWAGSLPGVRLAATIEIPYATAGGQDVTADSARRFGRNLAQAMRDYLDPTP